MTAAATRDPLLATDPARNASVHASAGTGKTWLLVTRILRLLLTGVRPDSILAVTFTRKAAGEMEQRIMERLRELMCASLERLDILLAQCGITPDDDVRARARQLYEQVLFNPWRLRATTFHAFCQELLQRFPLEAGVMPGFEILEATGLSEQAARDALLAETAAQPDGALAQALATLVEGCNGLHNAVASLRAFLARRSDWWAWVQDEPDAHGFACRRLADFLAIEPERDPLQGFPSAALRGQLAEFAALLERNTSTDKDLAVGLSDALAGKADQAALLDAISPVFLTAKGEPRARKASKAQQQRLGVAGEARYLALHAELSETLVTLHDMLARHRTWRTTTAWYTAGLRLLEHFMRIKREQRVLDFSDLEWQACELLNRSAHASWVQYKLDARIDHLLVDEFQDTNPTQWRLLLPLLEELAAGGAERARSVFLVGDRKQSIYSFRRANPALLGQASDWLAQRLDAQRFPLDASRRSAQAVMDCVNAVFGRPPLNTLLSDFTPHTTHLADDFGHVELLPLVTAADPPDTVAAARSGLRNPLQEPRRVAEDVRYATEGRLIATRIGQLVAAHTPVTRDGAVRTLGYGDVMILLRQRTHAGAYEDALRAAGIPYLSASKGLLLENLEVRDLVALLNTLIAPYDNLALAQVLRAPLFGLDSEQLVPLASGDAVYWYERLVQLADTGQTPYDAIHAQLERWRMLAGQVPVHDLLDRIFHEGEIVQRYEAAFPAALLPRVRASLTRFIELALEIDHGRYPSLPRFLEQLNRLRGSDQDQPDESTPDDAGGDRVRLLTIHGAKGLEAPVVFLADTAATPRSRDAYTVLLRQASDSARPDLFTLAGRRADADAATRTLLAQQEVEQRAEDANLLYVALTRARQYLFISGSQPDRGHAGSWYAQIDSALADWPQTTDGHRYRSTGTPAALSPRTVEPAPAIAVDPRLAQALTVRPAYIRIAPSLQAHAATDTAGDPDGRERGIAIHTLLEHLSRAPQPADAALRARLAGLLRRETGDPEFMHWWQHALEVVQDARLAALFDAGRFTQAWNEVPVQYLEDDRLVHGIIDRVVLIENSVTLIDYKTHRHAAPGTLGELVDAYRAQMRCYASAAHRLWPQHRLHTCLLFTACRELVSVDGLQSGA